MDEEQAFRQARVKWGIYGMNGGNQQGRKQAGADSEDLRPPVLLSYLNGWFDSQGLRGGGLGVETLPGSQTRGMKTTRRRELSGRPGIYLPIGG